jgi:hypothetical protein
MIKLVHRQSVQMPTTSETTNSRGSASSFPGRATRPRSASRSTAETRAATRKVAGDRARGRQAARPRRDRVRASSVRTSLSHFGGSATRPLYGADPTELARYSAAGRTSPARASRRGLATPSRACNGRSGWPQETVRSQLAGQNRTLRKPSAYPRRADLVELRGPSQWRAAPTNSLRGSLLRRRMSGSLRTREAALDELLAL